MFYTCNKCEISWCKRCKILQSDHKKECKDYLNSIYDEDTLKYFLEKESNGLIFRCPSCMVWIEKNGGCNHVTCYQCNIHICYKCKSVFDSSNKTYDHLSDVNGGCYGIF